MTPSLSIEMEMAERDQLVDPYAAWPISPDHIPEIVNIISWAKAPALYVTMSQEVVHFLDLAFRAQIELRNVKVKVTLR